MATLGEYNGAGSGTTKLLSHLNGNSTDDSGNANNGTDTSITYTAGVFRQAASFNGTTSKIALGTSTSLRLSIFTVSVWAKAAGNTGFIFDKKSATSGGHEAYGINLGLYEAGKVCVRIQQSVTPTFLDLKVTATFNDNSWHNYIFNYSGTVCNLYRDSVLIGTASGGAVYYGSDQNAYIGASESGGAIDNPFSGTIDEVIIENVVWSAEKIKKYYTFTKARFGII